MSDFAYALSGAAPLVKRYQTDATVANIGVPLLIDTAGEAGLNAGSTTSAADFVGMSVDTGKNKNTRTGAAYSTTQGVGESTAEYLVGVIIQPDAVFRALMSGGAAEGTNLTLYDVTTADTAGTAITTGDDWTSPQFDEGIIWGYDGANQSQIRKITSTSATAATVTIPFDNDTVVGDNFLRAPYWPFATTTLQLTTNLHQADASIAVATGAEYVVVDMELNDIGGNGRANSWVHFMARDHVLAGRPT